MILKWVAYENYDARDVLMLKMRNQIAIDTAWESPLQSLSATLQES